MGEGNSFSLFTSGGGGTPSQVWVGGYPIPVPGRGATPSQVQVGGYPIPGPGRGVPQLGGYPSQRGDTPARGYPSSLGVPQPEGGYPSQGGNPPPRNSKHLLRLRGGRYASCVHAGELSFINLVGLRGKVSVVRFYLHKLPHSRYIQRQNFAPI